MAIGSAPDEDSLAESHVWLSAYCRAVTVWEGDGVAIVLDGEIDLTAAPKLEALTQAVRTRSAPDGRIVIDMARVTFCDACGLQALLGLDSDAIDRVVVRRPSRIVRRLMTLMGVDQCVTIEHLGLLRPTCSAKGSSG